MRFVVTGLVGTLCLATAALGATGDALTVEGARVNVRADPGVASPVILQVDRGDRLVEIGRSGAWVNVEIPHHGGRQGWIHDSLVGAAAPAPGPTPTAGAETAAAPTPLAEEGRPLVEVQGLGANIRERPSSGAAVITAIDGGRVVAELGRELGWVHVELPDGRRGWIYGELVAPAAGRSAPPPQAAVAPDVEPEPAVAPQAAPAEEPAPEAAPAPERTVTVEAEPEPAPGDDRPRLEVLATTVSLRREPSRLAPVALQLERGREVIELSREAEWIEVAVLGSENDRGWVHRSLLGPARSAPPTTTTAAAVPGDAREPDAEIAEVEPAPTRIAITGGRVNVREGPGMEASVLMQLDDGTEVLELGRRGAWVRIATEGPDRREGWIHQSLVESVVAPPAVALQPEPTTPAPAPEAPAAVAQPEPPTAPPPAETATATAPPEPPAVAAAPEPRTAAVPPQAAPSPEEKAPEDSQTVEAHAEEMIDDDRFDRFKTSVESLNERVRRAAGVDVFSDVEDLGDGTVELTATEAWLAAPEAARRANLDTLFRLWGSVHEADEPIVVRIVEDDGSVAMERRRDEPASAPAAGRLPAGAGELGEPVGGL